MNRDKWEAAFLKSLNTQGNAKLASYFNEIRKSSAFLRALKRLRKKYEIPENGFNKNAEGIIPPPEWKHRHTPKAREMNKEIAKLCKKYGLHFLQWEYTIENLLFYNSFEIFADENPDLCKLADLRNEAEEPFMKFIRDADNSLYPLAIRISPFATQRDILDFVKKNYALIRPFQEHYRKEMKGYRIGKIKKKKPKVQERNEFIFEHRNLPRKQIMQKVNDRFGEVLDYGHIGKIISLEIKKRKEV